METLKAEIVEKGKHGFILKINVFLSKNGYNFQDFKVISNDKEYDIEVNIGKNPNTSTKDIHCDIDISNHWFIKGTVFNIIITQENKTPRRKKLIAQHSNDNIKPGPSVAEGILTSDMIH